MTRSVTCFVVVLATVCVLGAAAAGAAPLGSEFTYQGVLGEDGSPATGTYDFRFLLYDADVGGSQEGAIVYANDLSVTDGRVVVELDFGRVFGGTAMWLEVHVRDGGSTGSYTALLPRQPLTAGPYTQYAVQAETAATAAHATTADSATTAGDASTLGGHGGAYYLDWTNLTGVPGGLADGDDDTLGGLSCAAGEVAKWTGTAWDCTPDNGLPYARTYLVGPVGTPSENGAALLAAMAAIPTPASREDSAMLKIEPGVYDLGSSSLAMKPWVDVEGSGRDVTAVVSMDSSGTPTYAAVLGAADAELRSLTVDVTGPADSDSVTAVKSTADRFRMVHLDVVADCAAGPVCVGVDASGESTMATDVSADVSGPNVNGISIYGDTSTSRGIRVTATGTGQATGVMIGGNAPAASEIWATADGTSSSAGVLVFGHDVVMRDVVARASGSISTGLFLRPSGTNELVDVTAEADRAVYWWPESTPSTAIMRQVRAIGVSTGLETASPSTGSTVLCDDCELAGTTYSIENYDGLTSISVGASKIVGGISGTPICAGVYDENYVFYADSCP